MRSSTGHPPAATGERATIVRGDHAPPSRRRRGVAITAALGVLLVACGDTGGSDGGPPESDAGAADAAPQQEAAIAPECDELDRVSAEVPGGVEPLETGAEPVEDDAVPDAGASGSEEDTVDADGSDDARGVDDVDGADDPDVGDTTTLHQRIERWGQQEAPDSFAGVWVHDEAGVAVAFAEDVERYAEQVREEFHPGIAVAEVATSYAELREAQLAIQEREMGAGTEEGAVRTVGAQMMINRTTVGVFAPDEERLAELSETYGASTICFRIDPGPQPLPDGVEPLAKASQWRSGLAEGAEAPFAVIEVAYDRETAERAWEENVPEDLDVVEDELPAEPGLYGTLEDVDLDRQAIVVWSSGESGSCPGWLADIATVEGQVQVEPGATAQDCTADDNPYRMVLAVDLDRLPESDDLPLDDVEGVPDGVVSVYPSDDDDPSDWNG